MSTLKSDAESIPWEGEKPAASGSQPRDADAVAEPETETEATRDDSDASEASEAEEVAAAPIAAATGVDAERAPETDSLGSIGTEPEVVVTAVPSTERPERLPAIRIATAQWVDEDEEPFDYPGASKLGIVGGRGVGKSYLFQAMVYRTFGGPLSGALTYFLERDSVRLFSALDRGDRAKAENIPRFLQSYQWWERLLTTQESSQIWYRLRLRYRTGLLGQTRSVLDVELFDGSGEGFFEAARNPRNRQLWRDGYLEARVMVFCLPLWAAFPGPHLTDEDWRARDALLVGFEQVVENFATLRSSNQRTHPVATILALTMADDRRGALKTLRERWISPYLSSPHSYLKELRTGPGVARYLANARRISEALHEEFLALRDPMVLGIPQRLDFNGGLPWLIPVSAIEGSRLDEVEREREIQDATPRMSAPVPVHVELPLLVALSDRANALM